MARRDKDALAAAATKKASAQPTSEKAERSLDKLVDTVKLAWRTALYGPEPPADGTPSDNRYEEAERLGHLSWHFTQGDKPGGGVMVLGENLRLVLLYIAAKRKAKSARVHADRHLFSVNYTRDYSSVLVGKGKRSQELQARVTKLLEGASEVPQKSRSLREFLAYPFPGNEAPKQFLRWLSCVSERHGARTSEASSLENLSDRADAEPPPIRHMTSGRDPMSRLASPGKMRLAGGRYFARMKAEPQLEFFATPSRANSIEEIKRHLAPGSERGGDFKHRILCVENGGMTVGMTALAQELMSQCVPKDERPWCYLPLNRGVVTARFDGSSHDTTYRATVARLAAFYRGEDVTNADAEDTDESTDDRVAFIREAMTHRAAVLIFDGYMEQEPGDTVSRPSLTRLLRDEPLVLLLQKLIRPRYNILEGKGPTAECDGATKAGDGPTKAFEDTRILVLGSKPVTPLEGYFDRLPEPFPGQGESSLSSSLDWLSIPHKWDSKEEGLDYLKSVCGERFCTDEFALSAMAMLRISDGEAKRQGAIREAIEEAFSTDVNAPIIHGLIDLISIKDSSSLQSATWSELSPRILALLMLALSDTGLRPETLQRVIARTSDDKGGWNAISSKDAVTALQGLERDLMRIVVSGKDEVMAQLHLEPQGLEYDPPGPLFDPGIEADHPEHRVYEIPDINFRLRVRDYLFEQNDTLAKRLHLLMAEESLQQHAVMLRNSPSRSFLGLRYHRRALEGIVHGLLSLSKDDIAKASEEGTKDAAAPVFSVRTSILPWNPADRLVSLYAYYIQHIEHGSDWLLARMWGADEAKLELLEMFKPLTEERHREQITRQGEQIKRIAEEVHHSLGKVRLSINQDQKLNNELPPKLLVDVQLQQEDLKKTAAVCLQHVKRLGIKGSAISAQDKVRSFPRDSAHELEKLAAETVSRLQFPGDTTSGELGAIAANDIDNVVDLLERYAVVRAREAEFSQNKPERHLLFAKAYFWFRVSWLISVRRTEVGQAKPSGRSSRTFMRCCVHLAVTETCPKAAGDYVHRARQASNRLTAGMYRYASERADLLIIESSLARLDACRSVDLASAGLSLKRAARLLERAGDVLPAETSRPRLRARFLLERASLSITLAEFTRAAKKKGRPTPTASPTAHEGLAALDLEAVEGIIGKKNTIYAAKVTSLNARLKLHGIWSETPSTKWV